MVLFLTVQLVDQVVVVEVVLVDQVDLYQDLVEQVIHLQ
jgi:hypothetical protein